jgi:dolichol-phosphate mannosyltransferase
MRIAVVVPLLNEEGNLRELHARLARTLDGLVGDNRRIIFVDDGSTDSSAQIIRDLAAADPTVVGLSFSRNFGHEAASTAGFDFAADCGADAVVLMDADLQDPPETLVDLIAKWRQGFEIVYAVRRKREGETVFKRSTSWLFYRILDKLSDVKIPMDTGDFRLVDRKVVAALKSMRERDRFVRGLVSWTGFRTAAVEYDRPARFAGQTKYNPLKLLMLSLDATVSFSTKPLRLATGLGFLVTLLSLEEAARVFLQKLFVGNPIPGYALQTTGLFFIGGVQMLLLGVIGEYIARIYRQSQARPLYIVGETISNQSPNPRASETSTAQALEEVHA